MYICWRGLRRRFIVISKKILFFMSVVMSGESCPVLINEEIYFEF